MSRSVIAGCGVVGSSWAPVCRRAGLESALLDAVPWTRETAAVVRLAAVMTITRQALAEASAPPTGKDA